MPGDQLRLHVVELERAVGDLGEVVELDGLVGVGADPHVVRRSPADAAEEVLHGDVAQLGVGALTAT